MFSKLPQTEKFIMTISKLKDAVLASLTIDTGKGTAITTDATTSVYMENLPEGVTPETIKIIDDYDNRYVAACIQASGDVAAAVLAENPTAKAVRLTTPYHTGGSVAVNLRPTADVKEGGTTKRVFGQTTVKIANIATALEGGEIMSAQEMVSAALAAHFDKK